MLEALLHGLTLLMRLDVFGAMMIGVIVGLIFGLIPGVGALAALSILMPMVWGMDPTVALTLLLSVTCAVSQGGSATAILINVPGAVTNAATLFDGFPMAQKGQAGRALSAALTSSAFGGLFGGVMIIALIPVVRPLVLSFGSPELFFLAFLGLTFITAITEGKMLKGLISGAIGIVLSLFGYQPTTGIPRFTFGTVYLEDGIKLIPLVLGLFAFPEVIDMALAGRISGTGKSVAKIGSDILEGMKDTFRHFLLFIRCSVIGTIIGIIPGIGAEVAVFVCYAHAKQTSKHPERFGQGAVEGVIAPETGSNAKEGGALLTTLAFGIPGSVPMALLLGAFLIVGITPGAKMLEEHLALSFSLAWTVIVSNFISSALMLILARQLVKVTFIDTRIVAPIILVFASVGAYSVSSNMIDVVAAYLLAILGYGAKHLGYNRAAIILGFVMGGLAENYFVISFNAWGIGFPLRPVSIILMLLILFGMCYGQLSKIWRRREQV